MTNSTSIRSTEHKRELFQKLTTNISAPGKYISEGCYFFQVPSVSGKTYGKAGTMRIEKITSTGEYRVSADVYKVNNSSDIQRIQTIPVLPIENYESYWSVIDEIRMDTQGPSITFDIIEYKYNHTDREFEWGTEEYLKLKTGFLSKNTTTFDVEYQSGQVLTGTIRKVADFFREATIDIYRVKESIYPDTPINKNSWHDIFDKVGWSVAINDRGIVKVKNPRRDWTEAELHQQMLEIRKSSILNRQWSYFLFCVPLFSGTIQAPGVMFDIDEKENEYPREGAAISSEAKLPAISSFPGSIISKIPEAYYRTAIHEVLHAMGLQHRDNMSDNNLLEITTNIIRSAPANFPNNINFDLSEEGESDDRIYLKHSPDSLVRSGMSRFEALTSNTPLSQSVPVNITKFISLNIKESGLTIPFGAPVRVEFSIDNPGDKEGVMRIPESLSLKSTNMTVEIERNGDKGYVSSLVKRLDSDNVKLISLQPGESKVGSVTLIHDQTGPIYTQVASYNLTLSLQWSDGEQFYAAKGEASINVVPVKTTSSESRVLNLISRKDLLRGIAIGGRLQLGTIKKLCGYKILGPYYRYFLIKNYLTPYFNEEPSVNTAMSYIVKGFIASDEEYAKLVGLINSLKGEVDGQTIIDLKQTINENRVKKSIQS